MIAAALPYIMQGASLLGGLIGKKQQKIDPEYMRSHFGAGAIANEAQNMANSILSSGYGQQLMSSAATQGQQFATDMAAKAAASGLSADTGGQSGVGDFATSAAGQAQAGLERGVKSDVYASAMPVAAQTIAQQRADYEQARQEANAQPSMWQKIGTAAGQVASMLPTGAGVGGNPNVSPSMAGVVKNAVAAAPSMLSTAAGALAPKVTTPAVASLQPTGPVPVPPAAAFPRALAAAAPTMSRVRRLSGRR